jgi:SHS2 domain-containing protein
MAGGMERAWEPIDHTADAGFEIRGATAPELFANAARCLLEAIGGGETARREIERSVEVEAGGREALLRAWLSEVLYLSYVHKLALVDCEIVELSDTRLVATVTGERYDETRHERNPEIKAVTWHDLSVIQAADGWHARYILDL